MTPLTPPLCVRPPSRTRSAHLWYTAWVVFALRDARRERYVSRARLFTFPTALGATGQFSLSDDA